MSDLAIRNWSKYQHYGNRPGLPWVKFHVELLDDDAFSALPEASRLVGCLLLLVARRRGNRFPNSGEWLAAELKIPTAKAKRALSDLLALRFLVPASEVASDTASAPASESASASSPDAASKAASPPARPRTRGEGDREKEEREEANASSSEQSPKKASTVRKPDALWDTLEREIGPAETKSERGRRNKALAELRDVGATPGELVVRSGRYRRRWPDIDLTATALAANWSLLASGPNGSSTFRPESEEEREERIVRELAARGPRT